jgi:hypothetical protein
MERPEPDRSRSSKYIVTSRLSRWSVRRNGQDAGAFADRDEAVRFACARARDEALAGTVGVVVVMGQVHEMHCFTPTHVEHAAPPEPRFRVVEGGA